MVGDAIMPKKLLTSIALVTLLVSASVPAVHASKAGSPGSDGCKSLLVFDYKPDETSVRYIVRLKCLSRKKAGGLTLEGKLAGCIAPGVGCHETDAANVNCESHERCVLRLRVPHPTPEIAHYSASVSYDGDGKERPSGSSSVNLVCYTLPNDETGCEG